jgi:hypothetical protein
MQKKIGILAGELRTKFTDHSFNYANDKIHSEKVLRKQNAHCSEFKCNGITNRQALARDRLEWRKTVLETKIHSGK